jgi:hypothetical protein
LEPFRSLHGAPAGTKMLLCRVNPMQSLSSLVLALPWLNNKHRNISCRTLNYNTVSFREFRKLSRKQQEVSQACCYLEWPHLTMVLPQRKQTSDRRVEVQHKDSCMMKRCCYIISRSLECKVMDGCICIPVPARVLAETRRITIRTPHPG